jgi:hypothetical protein
MDSETENQMLRETAIDSEAFAVESAELGLRRLESPPESFFVGAPALTQN